MDDSHRKYRLPASHRPHPMPAASVHLPTANSLRPSGSNRQHIPSTNTLSIVPTNTISIPSFDRQNHPYPDDPPSSSSTSQRSPDTDSSDVPALKQSPPLSDRASIEPSSGVHRTLKSNVARDTLINRKAPKDGVERRKRNRVTPEQLVQLETAFSNNRHPISRERRELSNRIGMTERALQIWFQNRSVNIFPNFSVNTLNFPSLARRAKAKHQPPIPATQTANPPPLISSLPVSPPLGVAQEGLTQILNEREGMRYPRTYVDFLLASL